MQGYDYGGGDGYGGVGRYDADGYGSGLRGSLEQGSGVGSPRAPRWLWLPRVG
jgi:hypothetical protein